MFNRLNPIVGVPLRYGLISGVVGFILLIALYYMGHHPFLVAIYFDFRIVLFSVFIVFCQRELRDFYYDGLLSFWQGMLASFLLTIIYATVSSALLLMFTMAVPEFVSSFISLATEQAKTYTAEEIERIGKDVYEQGMASLQKADGQFMASRYFFQSYFISFLISIIISLILRRQPKTPESI